MRILSFDLHQHCETRLALYQRCDVGVFRASDQVAFPVTGDGTILDLCRTVVYRNVVDDLPSWLTLSAGVL
jgi:hypothetical protein